MRSLFKKNSFMLQCSYMFNQCWCSRGKACKWLVHIQSFAYFYGEVFLRDNMCNWYILLLNFLFDKRHRPYLGNFIRVSSPRFGALGRKYIFFSMKFVIYTTSLHGKCTSTTNCLLPIVIYLYSTIKAEVKTTHW